MRLPICSFMRMFEMWFLTVFGLMWSSPAICALSLPLAISFSTSISRSDSSERIVSAASAWGVDVCVRRADAMQHLRRDVRGDQRLADGGRADARDQLGDRRVLHQVAAGA